jgi:DNA-binding NarL/FixJ family response regulator
MSLQILILEDQPLMASNYCLMMQQIVTMQDADFIITYNAQEAAVALENDTNNKTFDIILLDYSIPACIEKKLFNGCDVGLLAKKNFPSAKIVLITSIFEGVTVSEILQILGPHALLYKNDIDSKIFFDAFLAIHANKTFYSAYVSKIIHNPLFAEQQIDLIDGKIIKLISQGFQRKSIAAQLFLSEGSIKNRKAKIADYLGIKAGNDEILLRACRERGLL